VNVEGFRNGLFIDSYASTKARGEELVLGAVNEGGLDAVVVRPATVFGNVQGRAGLLVDRLLGKSLRMLPAPARMISPVWAGDLAVGLIRAAEVDGVGEVYTVAGPSMTTRDFVAAVADSAGVPKPLVSIPAWMVAVPLQLAWWGRGITHWTPPVSVESVFSGSVYDGSGAARDLGFSYTPIGEIFGVPTGQP
jgi:nucleoside-diphosphate-sugar epimerase